jgi:hypothetical protein
MAMRGREFQYDGHSYRVIRVSNDRYMLEPWQDNRRVHAYCVIDFDVDFDDAFEPSLTFRVRAPQLKMEERHVTDLKTLLAALEAGAGLVEKVIAQNRY